MISPTIKDDIHELLVGEAGMTDEQWVKLCALDYFKAPASSKHHNCFEGGLAAHSLNVCKTALTMNESLNLGLKRSNVILASLLHDICKCGYYTKNILKSGKQSESQPYKVAQTLFMQHGPDSVYLINNSLGMIIPQDVATAIAYHMPFDYTNLMETSMINKMSKFPTTMMLVWLIQSADNFASQIMEADLS